MTTASIISGNSSIVQAGGRNLFGPDHWNGEHLSLRISNQNQCNFCKFSTKLI